METKNADSGVRKRKKQKNSSKAETNGSTVSKGSLPKDGSKTRNDPTQPSTASSTYEDFLSLVRGVWIIVGLGLAIYSGTTFTWYIRTLHENNMWFSHISEVEREISLRTECGLYYSYFKQIINSNHGSLAEAVTELTVDNATEHGRTINLLSRFNIYQEVFLAALFKMTHTVADTAEPILFYVYSIFKLNGIYVACLYALAWYLTGMWPAGLLAALQFAANIDDTTRVFFTINLREHFAFPFFWAQVLAICVYLERGTTARRTQAACLTAIFIFTFFFGITWQFNQFLLLLQCFSLYALGVLQLGPQIKIRKILTMIGCAMFTVGVAQFFQPMILGSTVLSFIPAAIVMLYLFRDVPLAGGILDGSFRIFCQIFLVLSLSGVINVTIKHFIPVEADAHIFKFLKGKFGFGNPLDFESRLYLCHGAFVFLDNDFFLRTSKTLLFPTYFITMLGFLFLIGKNLLLEWCTATVDPGVLGKAQPEPKEDISDKPFLLNQRPNLAYLTIQSVFAGILALMTLRMKYFWTPHMVVLGPVVLADYDLWYNVLSVKKNKFRKDGIIHGIRYGLTLIVIAIVVWRAAPTVRSQLDDLREFWDPDTVELMKWIQNNTDTTASFAGSMQLLAGIKCCTGRHLVNHPHFEDKWLRDRTKEVYQIYGRRHPDEVHALLKKNDAQFIVLEDSICLARSDNCRTPDLVDLDNKVIPDNEYVTHGLKKSTVPRFCNEIRHGDPAYTKFFKLVLQNRTFRVYKVL